MITAIDSFRDDMLNCLEEIANDSSQSYRIDRYQTYFGISKELAENIDMAIRICHPSRRRVLMLHIVCYFFKEEHINDFNEQIAAFNNSVAETMA